MKNTTKPLLFTLLTTSLFFNFIGCQKQNIENTPQQTSTSQTNIAQENTINRHDYNIALDKAALYTKRYRESKPKEEDLIAYRVPAESLRQLLQRVDTNEMRNKVAHVTFYLGINDAGRRTVVYVATKEDGTDVLQYPKEKQTNGFDVPTSPTYDLVGELTSGGVTVPNALTGGK